MSCSYVGNLGALVPVYVSLGAASSTDENVQTMVTLGGRRFARRGKGRHRSWSVPAENCRPSDLVNLSEFASGMWGRGPFWWVDGYSARTNVLPPAYASLGTGWSNGVMGGPADLVGGVFAPRTVVSNGNAILMQDPRGYTAGLPVVPGMPVTFAAFLSDPAAFLIIDCMSADGARLARFSSVPSGAAGWSRVHVSGVVPEGTRHAILRMSGAGSLALPTLTWTDTVMPVAPGAGADKVIITEDAQTPVYVGDGTSARVTGKFNVIEVG